MTGVEILTSNEVVSEYAFNWASFWAFLIVVIIIVTIFVICNYKKDKNINSVNDLFCMYVVFTLLGCCYGALLGNVTHEPIAYETQYQVTVSDDVSMVEFMENYEIIKQDGKIYTVRERE